jgi:two-component system, NarL family, sensor histidine kinase DegS
MATEQISLADLERHLDAEAAKLDSELSEIELLIQQARTEAARHEQKRTQAAERYGVQDPSRQVAPVREQMDQLMMLTKRASLMEAQVDILEGKQKALNRYRDAIREIGQRLEHLVLGQASAGGGDGTTDMPPALTRAILAAQENLRREISRQMHDGPAQSLTNIVLQAQIVERLVRRDPQQAHSEIAQLIDMVQHTLDATKTFIFEVRPMVLDDLGLVPTLRRAAHERSRRSGVAISFDSVGADRRLLPDLESGLFRIIDDAASGLATTSPDRIAIRLEWSDEELGATVAAERQDGQAVPASDAKPGGDQTPIPADRRGLAAERQRGIRRRGGDVPPALAALLEQDRADAAAASAAAASTAAAAAAIPPAVWREIRQRAGTLGVEVQLSEDGQGLRIRAPLER